MSKSHKRGGAKEHRKRVAARNERIKNDWKRMSKAAWETFDKMKEEKIGKENENSNGNFISLSDEDLHKM